MNKLVKLDKYKDIDNENELYLKEYLLKVSSHKYKDGDEEKYSLNRIYDMFKTKEDIDSLLNSLKEQIKNPEMIEEYKTFFSNMGKDMYFNTPKNENYQGINIFHNKEDHSSWGIPDIKEIAISVLSKTLLDFKSFYDIKTKNIESEKLKKQEIENISNEYKEEIKDISYI